MSKTDCGMESEGQEPSDDLVEFMRKRSRNAFPTYATKLKNYTVLKKKHLKAAAARQRAGTKQEEKPNVDAERRGRRVDEQLNQRRSEKGIRGRSGSKSHSHEPEDACSRPRRRRCRGRFRRGRRRSCRRRRRSSRRRRRSSRRRRRSSRRRRRSRSRRRRRRSCCRRRRRRRRCRRR